MQVMKEREATKPLAGWIQLDDAFWGGRRRGKRGRGARGKTPLVAAVATDEQRNPQRLRLTRVRGFRLREIARWSQLHLYPRQPRVLRWARGSSPSWRAVHRQLRYLRWE
jgi:hypothetical protein